MRKIILIAHSSLDGFVARVDGSFEGFPVDDENLAFVCSLTNAADAALFGRVSFQLLDKYWPKAYSIPDNSKPQIDFSNWYNKAEKIVVSKTCKDKPSGNYIFIEHDMEAGIAALQQLPGRDILLFGSPTLASALLKAQLIDSCWIFVNPVFFGQGIPLFRGTVEFTRLELLSIHPFRNGETAMHYNVCY